MRARPNCTALTIFTSSCLEVWTGPLPGRKQDYSTNVSAEKRLWRNYFKTQRCLTIQFFLNENKNIKSLTNPVDSRRGAWIGPAATTGEVRVWKLLKRYFHFLNTILENHHDCIITKIKWRGLSTKWVSEWFHLLSFLIAIWEDFSYEDWEIPGGKNKDW